jgi:hypothetical protein
MLKKDVKIGAHYAIHHEASSRRLSIIRIDSESRYGGYNALKLKTGRMIRVKSAAKLRFEVVLNPAWPSEKPKWIPADEAPKKIGFEYTDCEACGGTGIYHGRGYVENGVFKGFKGTCFRCEGKGYQNEADRRRNWGYDQNRRIAP